MGLWLLIIAAPIAARYMIPMGPGAEGVRITVGSHLPEMTSGFLGVSLGIVVSTLVLPIAWLYLRSNTTRRQPWQVEEVTAASRVAIALGRFAADAIVLMTTLVALTSTIDKAFLDDPSPKRAVLLKSMVSMAHELGMSVVAEGLSDEHDALELRQMGCEYVQSYMFGPPMAGDLALKMLKEQYPMAQA